MCRSTAATMSETSKPLLLISAAHKSSGKTVLTVGLIAALRERGLAVHPFKKGPDYIDAGWLGLAADRPCYNLDFNTQSKDEIAAMLGRLPAAALALIEANKGLHDGLSTDGHDSNAALAGQLGAPVVLVLDCTGMTRGVAALVLGQQQLAPHVSMAAVILNQVRGARHERKLRAAIEHYTDVPVVGALPHTSCMQLPERHLGLMPAAEARTARTAVQSMARCVAEHVALDELVAHAHQASALPVLADDQAVPKPCMRLGVFRDAAFSFYYPDDWEALRRQGFELVLINSLSDAQLPAIDALFIGGGFPETQMDALAANQGLLRSVRSAIEGGLPAYAECGGLMYLARSLEWHGQRRPMAAVLDCDIVVADTPQGRGYARIEESEAMPWPRLDDQQSVHPAHEFHYSHIVSPGAELRTAYKVLRGTGIDGQRDGIVYKNLLASYIHRRATRHHDWTAGFAAFVQQQKA